MMAYLLTMTAFHLPLLSASPMLSTLFFFGLPGRCLISGESTSTTLGPH